ncbi:MAG: hypothetical protein ABJB74_07060 [Gemmatimonas sp.]
MAARKKADTNSSDAAETHSVMDTIKDVAGEAKKLMSKVGHSIVDHLPGRNRNKSAAKGAKKSVKKAAKKTGKTVTKKAAEATTAAKKVVVKVAKTSAPNITKKAAKKAQKRSR